MVFECFADDQVPPGLHIRMLRQGEIPQSETTPSCPRSPFGVAKMHSYWCQQTLHLGNLDATRETT